MNWVKAHNFAIWTIFWSSISLVGLTALLTGVAAGVILLLFGLVMLIKEVITNGKVHAR